ncbi:hypothetical protein FOA52_003152 [Chlamydomonas sp. UWO 241]|nr:hypothetical protein FOA52_003152 [Chlamydomonas sp. UWO 241]
MHHLGASGRTELGLAGARGDKKEVLRLLRADVPGEASLSGEADSFLDTPLHLAALFGYLDVVKWVN